MKCEVMFCWTKIPFNQQASVFSGPLLSQKTSQQMTRVQMVGNVWKLRRRDEFMPTIIIFIDHKTDDYIYIIQIHLRTKRKNTMEVCVCELC